MKRNKTAWRKRKAYRITNAAALLDIGKSKAYEMVAAGKIRTVDIGGCQRVTDKELDNLLESLGDDRDA